MKPWAFIFLIAAILTDASNSARSQSMEKPFLIAALVSGSLADAPRYMESFQRGLRELGHVEGRDYLIEVYSANGNTARLSGLARDLMQRRPRIIFASSGPAVLAASKETTEVPIVSPFMGLSATLGVIVSQARPGGNVTGILGSTTEGLIGKQVALIRDLIPGATKIGFLVNTKTTVSDASRVAAETAAANLSLERVIADAQSPGHLGEAIASLASAGVNAIWVAPDPMFFTERKAIAAAAEASALPTVFAFREHVEAGGLASYGIDLVESYRRAAAYADKIIRGAKPAEIPVELATKFELVVNAKTARAVGLAIPETFLVHADEVIE
jgi:putative tryptophan/tyrosine transport system substrate-binding protein